LSVTQEIYTAYSSPTDVAGLLTTAFSASSNPSFTLVQDIILRQDSFIDRATAKKFRLNFVQDERYDMTGIGPRAGQVVIRKYPVVAIQQVQWYDGTKWNNAAQLDPQDPAVLAGGGSLESFFFYPEKNKIEFYKLRTTQRRQGIRISYTWGHTLPPDYIRDLSASLAAYEVVRGWAAIYYVAENVSNWRADMGAKIERLLRQAGVKASGWVG
jgi:hypothetical protein